MERAALSIEIDANRSAGGDLVKHVINNPKLHFVCDLLTEVAHIRRHNARCGPETHGQVWLGPGLHGLQPSNLNFSLRSMTGHDQDGLSVFVEAQCRPGGG